MALRKITAIKRTFRAKPRICPILILALITAGCAVSQKDPVSNPGPAASANHSQSPSDDDFDLLQEELAEEAAQVEDPLEPFNRLMFNVNDTLYFWVVKPVTSLYTNITPEPARIAVRNFFYNLTTPVRFVNCHLQGKPKVADIELNRFLINTTEGILGFGDPAKDKHNLEPPDAEDFGQTLATCGFGNSFYIVWPLLGPSTLRDSVGITGGIFLNPVFYVEPTEASISINAAQYTNESSFHIGEYEAFKSASLDPYVAMRQAYIQYRNKKIRE